MFKGRQLLIASKHQKEIVIAPAFENAFGLTYKIAENFDSDVLGTFTGEVERLKDPISTAKEKCLLALKTNNCDLVIASEGSFGPHPSIFFVPANEEILMLLDTKNDLEITAQYISTETNFNGAEVKAKEELLSFAKAALFPSHGLILRKSKNEFEDIIKGIVDENVLVETFNTLQSTFGTAFVETDMRAMYNPSRMKVIALCVNKLIEAIKSVCLQCTQPGFTVAEAIPGLPCEACTAPTKSTLKYVLRCKKCGYQTEEQYPQGKRVEEAMYCDFCNP